MLDRIALLLGLPADAPHLEQALTHPSYANERRGLQDNQRLEFLGDSVLGFCTSDILFERFPTADEGTLTRIRALLVNADTLAAWARSIDLQAELRLGRGADAGGLRESTNVLADAVEALIAAAYLDGGLDAARRLCEQIVRTPLESMEVAGARDPKSELQERIQAKGGEPPTYVVVESSGPAHARRFAVSVRIGERAVAEGRGRSKREAERAAAAEALRALGPPDETPLSKEK
jgi:ribonuclease III